MNPLAKELNENILKANPHIYEMLSQVGKKLYFPKGILTQSAEAKEKAKEVVIQFLLDNEPNFVVEYTKTGKIKPQYYDIADSIVIAKAGWELVQQRENSGS